MTAKYYSKDTPIPARYYAELRPLLHAKGIDDRPIWDKAKLRYEDLCDSDAGLSLEQVEHIVAAVNKLGIKGIALDLGKTIRLRKLALVGYAILSSPTIDYALRVTCRYFRLIFAPMRLRYWVEGKKGTMSLSPVVAMSPECLNFHIEMFAVTNYIDLEELVQYSCPHYEMRISSPEPDYGDKFRKAIPKANLHFGALDGPGYELSFPTSIIGDEPAMSNNSSLEVAEQRCRQLLDQMVYERNLGEWTRMMLRESYDGMPSMQELAEHLNINIRTYNRHLKRENLSFREIFNEEQIHKARDLLALTRLSITSIAQDLGYSDTSNFTRAFKAVTGTTPSAFRRSLPKK